MNANSNITHLNDTDFSEQVEQGTGLTLVDFWAEW